MQTIKMSQVQMSEILKSDGLRWVGLHDLTVVGVYERDQYPGQNNLNPVSPMSHALAEWTNTSE